MASLYARYVPPKKTVQEEKSEVLQTPPVQAQQLYARYIPPKNVAADLTSVADDTATVKHAGKKRKRGDNEQKPAKGARVASPPASDLEVPASKMETSEQELPAPVKKPSKKSKRERKNEQTTEVVEHEPNGEAEDESETKKHSNVMSKFQKSIRAAEGKVDAQPSDEETEPPPVLHGMACTLNLF